MNDEKNPREPTATAPESVAKSVPDAAERAGKSGPNASDPPLAAPAGRHGDKQDDSDDDAVLDPGEGADAFETEKDAEEGEPANPPERQDEDIIALDTPD